MTERVDLTVGLAGATLVSPVLVASGTFGHGREYADFVDLPRLGAVVTKGVSAEPWPGNPSPRMAETASGMLNSIGLQNPGVEAFCSEHLTWLQEQRLPTIVNVAGHTVEEYARVIGRLDREPGILAYEINVSCPNVDEGGMAFGTTCEGVEHVTAACRSVTERAIVVKLSPNVTDIVEVARAARDAGADGLSLINTLLGMAVDAETGRPKLGRVVGGLSGPAIKPVALRMVWQVSQAVDVPIIGMGGIATAEDAVEFLLAGATAVAVGTANFVDPRSAERVIEGIEEHCRARGLARAADLTGALKVER
jgi:dihydroorotate dehydrogenase (NAD+) catalytic subunit